MRTRPSSELTHAQAASGVDFHARENNNRPDWQWALLLLASPSRQRCLADIAYRDTLVSPPWIAGDLDSAMRMTLDQGK